jgi:O-antigen/teichoic acid export membrane protein
MLYSALVRHIIANGIGMALSLAYQVIVGRNLSGPEFSHLQALFSWQAVINGFLSYIILVETHRLTALDVSGHLSDVKQHIGRLVKGSYLTSAVSIVLVASFWFFESGTFLPHSAYACYVLLAFVLSLITAVTSGLRWFKLLSIQSIVPHITKLLITCVFLYFGLGFNGIVAALPISVIVLNFILLSQITKKINCEDIARPSREFNTILTEPFSMTSHKLLSLAVGNTAIAIGANLDILLVTGRLPAEQAGPYVKISIITKFFMYLAAAMGSIIFPSAAHSMLVSASIRKSVAKALGIVTLAGGLFVAAFGSFGEAIVNLVFSSDFKFSAEILFLGSGFSVVAGIYYILFNYLAGISKNWYHYACGFALGISMATGFTMPWGIYGLITSALTGVSTCVFIGVFALYEKRNLND